MLRIELMEDIEVNEEKKFVALKYRLYNDKNKKYLDMRTNLYDNNQTTTYVYTFKKNFITSEVEEYLETFVDGWKQLIVALADNFNKTSEVEKEHPKELEEIFNCAVDKLEFKVPVWLKAEWLVAKYFNGEMATTGQAGYDVMDSDGVKYQVKVKKIFNDNGEQGNRGAIEFRSEKSLDFDKLIVVGVTETDERIIDVREWSIGEVKSSMGNTNTFSISNKEKFETGKKINLF